GLFDRALHRFVELVEGGTGVALVLSGRDGDGALVVALLVEGVGPVLGGYPVVEGVDRVGDRAVVVEADPAAAGLLGVEVDGEGVPHPAEYRRTFGGRALRVGATDQVESLLGADLLGVDALAGQFVHGRGPLGQALGVVV